MMSKYNFYTYDDDRNLLIYNFLTGLKSLTKVEQKNVDMFKQVFLDNKIIGDDICNQHLDAVEHMVQNGILVDNHIDESALYSSKYYSEIYDSKLNLFLLPTGKCNFNCVYCFENNEPFFRGTMSINNQKAILKFLQKNLQNHRALHISWFGGEPLLEPQIIKYLSENIIKMCKTHYKPYSAEITTNGYFLDINTFDMLYNLKIYNYMITLDGFKEQHDKQRMKKNGTGTYDVIMKNLLEIRRHTEYKFANIKIRINMTRNFLDILDDFIYFINTTFADDPRFSFQFSTAMDFSDPSSPKKDLYIDFNDVYPQLMENNLYATKFYSEEQKIYPIDVGQRCVSNFKNSYVIAPDLNVYKCYSHYEMDVNKIGRLSSGGELIIDETLHRKWYLQNSSIQKIPKECNDCFYLPACHYGDKVCPVRYLKSIHDKQPCPIKNPQYYNKLTDTILYAVKKYPYKSLVMNNTL